MEPLRGPRTVEMRSGTISNFRSDHPGAGGTYTFCGLQLLSPKILSYIPNGFSTIIEAYEAAMADGWRVAGHEIPGSYWADVGNAEQYLDANREVAARQKGSRADGTQIDPGADVHGKAKLHNAVVLQNASVGARARCCNVIVGPGTRVNTECSGLVTRAAATCTTAERKALERLGLRPDRACIEKNHRSGSDRAFYRVTDGATSVILVRYGLEREENDLYADHAVLLRRAGVRVPRLHAADRRNRFLVMEDAGRHSVEDLFPGWPEPDAARVYHEVIEQVFQFHRGAARLARAGRVRLMPRFDDSLCRWEHGWFETHFLRPRGVPRRTCKAVLHELRTLSRGLCGGRASLLHRDLQSSNILVQRGRPVFIDFQGMRLGPAAYDIASLICDPYVMLSLDTQEELTEHYRSFDRAAARRTTVPGIHSTRLQHDAPGGQTVRKADKHPPGGAPDCISKGIWRFPTPLTVVTGAGIFRPRISIHTFFREKRKESRRVPGRTELPRRKHPLQGGGRRGVFRSRVQAGEGTPGKNLRADRFLHAGDRTVSGGTRHGRDPEAGANPQPLHRDPLVLPPPAMSRRVKGQGQASAGHGEGCPWAGLPHRDGGRGTVHRQPPPGCPMRETLLLDRPGMARRFSAGRLEGSLQCDSKI